MRLQPTVDDAAACMVARDMREEQRDEAAIRTLLDKQAPGRLGRRCPACGASPGHPCVDLTLPIEFTVTASGDLLIPHEERFVGLIERREECSGCKQEIDPDTCHCGDLCVDHDPYNDGHAPVPMGCVCWSSVTAAGAAS